jgi:hypothetical protein
MIRTLLPAADSPLVRKRLACPETVAITAAKTADGQRQSATLPE